MSYALFMETLQATARRERLETAYRMARATLQVMKEAPPEWGHTKNAAAHLEAGLFHISQAIEELAELGEFELLKDG